MVSEVINLDDYRACELLAETGIYRTADGSILIGITYMDPKEIDSVDTVSERFLLVSGWIEAGLVSLNPVDTDIIQRAEHIDGNHD